MFLNISALAKKFIGLFVWPAITIGSKNAFWWLTEYIIPAFLGIFSLPRYLKFLKSQEVLSEPFRDKLGQLDNFYLPLSKKIYDNYSKDKKTKIIGLSGGQGAGKSTISGILKIILKEYFNLKT